MSQSAADDLGLMRRWTRVVRAQLRRSAPHKPGIRLHVSFGFAFLALVGTCSGVRPAPHLALLLLAMMLLHELPAALAARAIGRFVRIQIQSSGGQSEVSGAPVPLSRRFLLALAGSAVSLAFGYGLLLLAKPWHSSVLVEAGRLQLFWGAIQLVPLVPFKLGILLREQVGQLARVKQAIASFGLAVATLLRGAGHLEAPLILIAFALWLYLCGRELLESVLWARDVARGADLRLDEIRKLTLGDQAPKAVQHALALSLSVRSLEFRALAASALAWAAIGAGDVSLARYAIAKLPESSLNTHLLASYLATHGRTREAIDLLTEAAVHGVRSSESLKLLADLYYRDDDRVALAALAGSAKDMLSEEDLSRIARALSTAEAESAPHDNCRALSLALH